MLPRSRWLTAKKPVPFAFRYHAEHEHKNLVRFIASNDMALHFGLPVTVARKTMQLGTRRNDGPLHNRNWREIAFVELYQPQIEFRLNYAVYVISINGVPRCNRTVRNRRNRPEPCGTVGTVRNCRNCPELSELSGTVGTAWNHRNRLEPSEPSES
uniref:Uncharacterized protein n=1 Tax=Anopheles culicifacies TaxID=139723 RepID=A0A182MC34_9DIPT